MEGQAALEGLSFERVLNDDPLTKRLVLLCRCAPGRQRQRQRRAAFPSARARPPRLLLRLPPCPAGWTALLSRQW
jgi:hypothetical protein